MSASKSGTLFGVGLGPGDPELMTLKATRALHQADVIAYFAKAGNPSHSRTVAEHHLRAGVVELPLAYPITTELPKCSTGYRDAVENFYARAADEIAKHLKAGRVVRILEKYELQPWPIHIIYPATDFLSNRVRVLIDFFADAFSRNPWVKDVQ